jgi:hypothetical protein
MTPFEVGLITFCALIGIMLPFIIATIFVISAQGVFLFIREVRDARIYKRFMRPEYWFFRGAAQCPNPDYIEVHFENSESREMVILSFEKKEIRGLIK